MKLTFPHMGDIYIPLKSFFSQLDIDVIVPPLPTQKTLELGVKNSPEFACLPLKINIGNFIEAFERGADTILMAGGVGPCRFGYYAQVEKEILKDLGYKFDMIVLEPPQGRLKDVLKNIGKIIGKKSLNRIFKSAKLAWLKAKVLEDIEKNVIMFRPLEKNRGETTQIYRLAKKKIDEAEDEESLKKIYNELDKMIKSIKLNDSLSPIKIAIIGEIYTVLEPFVNLNIIEKLGEMGVEVIRTINLTEWANLNIFLDLFRIKGEKEVKKAAKPYLNYFVGGHGLESVGNSVLLSKGNCDGIIHLAPFTCMPEIVAQSILPNISRKLDIPIMSLVIDEHSAEAGFVTRLEAFIDLLKAKKEGYTIYEKSILLGN